MAEDDLSFDLDAAGLRADHADMRAYVEALAHKLELALPSMTTVSRRSKGFLSRDKIVERIEVSLGDQRYVLQIDGVRVQCARAKAVRDVTIKTEPLEADDWVRALAADLQARAAPSAEARAALGRLGSWWASSTRSWAGGATKTIRGGGGGLRGAGGGGFPLPPGGGPPRSPGGWRTSRGSSGVASHWPRRSASASSRVAGRRSPRTCRWPTSRSPSSARCARSAR